MTTLDKAAIRALIPHALGMCLLDRVLHWDDATIDCECDSHRDPANPLRDATGLRALHAFEYAAQAAALHGALTAGGAANAAAGGVGNGGRTAETGRARSAFLAAVRDARVHMSRLDILGASLAVRADLLLAGEAGTIYAFRVDAGEFPVASGRLTVIPRPPG